MLRSASAAARLGGIRSYTPYGSAPIKTAFKLDSDQIDFIHNNQTVYLGTESLKPLAASLREKGFKRPLIVSDRGLERHGLINDVLAELRTGNIDPVVFADTQPNPAVKDVVAIAEAFDKSGCDMCVGLGGGGPLDAAKAGMLVVAVSRTRKGFNIGTDTGEFLTSEVRPYLKSATTLADVLPEIAAIPTTAGTGSEGGKSAVITDLKGAKVVFGHPALMPRLVALVPQLTQKMPPRLTAATGVDALYHCTEAFFVTHEAAIADGLSDAQILRVDAYALAGIRLVLQNLQKAFTNGSDLSARLNMQVAALFGAKAFRKGDLGGIHATAHAVGARYHLHHGECVGRMAAPVLRFNESRFAAPQRKQAKELRGVYKEAGFDGATLVEASEKFLSSFSLPLGIADLKPDAKALEELATAAANDVCGTNPVPVTKADYLAIFNDAAGVKPKS